MTGALVAIIETSEEDITRDEVTSGISTLIDGVENITSSDTEEEGSVVIVCSTTGVLVEVIDSDSTLTDCASARVESPIDSERRQIRIIFGPFFLGCKHRRCIARDLYYVRRRGAL